jgi:hypothetical protein
MKAWINCDIFPSMLGGSASPSRVYDYDQNEMTDNTPHPPDIVEWWLEQVHLAQQVRFVNVIGSKESHVRSITKLLQDRNVSETVQFLAFQCATRPIIPREMELWRACSCSLETVFITLPHTYQYKKVQTEDHHLLLTWLAECSSALQQCKRLKTLHMWWPVPLNSVQQFIRDCPSLRSITLTDMDDKEASSHYWSNRSIQSLVQGTLPTAPVSDDDGDSSDQDKGSYALKRAQSDHAREKSVDTAVQRVSSYSTYLSPAFLTHKSARRDGLLQFFFLACQYANVTVLPPWPEVASSTVDSVAPTASSWLHPSSADVSAQPGNARTQCIRTHCTTEPVISSCRTRSAGVIIPRL